MFHMLIVAGAALAPFVSPAGSDTRGTGGRERPFRSVERALMAGSEAVLLPGDYPNVIVRREGATVRADVPLTARVVADGKRIGTPPHGILIVADNVTIEGLEVTCQPYPPGDESHPAGGMCTGIKVETGKARNCTIRRCYIRDCPGDGIEAHDAYRLTVESCIIAGNGVNPLAHGIYADGTGLRIVGNYVANNYGYGIHLWSNARAIVGAVVERNVVVGHRRGTGIILVTPADGKGGGNRITDNILVGNLRAIDTNRLGTSERNSPGEIVERNVVTTRPARPVRADLDADYDVDMADYGLFQKCMNGAKRAPKCAE